MLPPMGALLHSTQMMSCGGVEVWIHAILILPLLLLLLEALFPADPSC